MRAKRTQWIGGIVLKKSFIWAGLAAVGLLFVPLSSAHADPFIENDLFPSLDTALVLLGPSGSSEIVNFTGSLQVAVTFPTTEGSATDTDGNGLDQVPTEIVSLNLTGTSSLGTITLGLNPGMPSLGEIEELVNNTLGILDVDPFAPGTASSFFDLFFRLTVGGSVLHNADSARMAGLISHKPPSEAVMGAILGSFGPVELYDENNNPTGYRVAGAVPEPGTWLLFATGLLGLAGYGWSQRRRERLQVG